MVRLSERQGKKRPDRCGWRSSSTEQAVPQKKRAASGAGDSGRDRSLGVKNPSVLFRHREESFSRSSTDLPLMYHVIRCPGCLTFTYVDPYQRWKLCHVCGEVIDVSRAVVYLEAVDHHDAETIVRKLTEFLEDTGRGDLNEEEKRELRSEYARWVRSRLA